MHKLGVAVEIARVAVEQAERARAKRITHSHLLIGSLSTIVDDSVQL
jgi:Zn finger protein HypA/HybF involved in hydrogenase expression